MYYFIYRPLHPEMIVQSALSKVGDVGYNMLFNNCEHFATWCRYGISMSHQVCTWNIIHYKDKIWLKTPTMEIIYWIIRYKVYFIQNNGE